MSRVPNTATKDELAAIHKAKMAGKKHDHERRYRTQPTRLQAAMARYPEGTFTRLAHVNRHTLDPHTNAAEIARRERQAERVNANRESRLDNTGERTRGYAFAAGQRLNFSRRGNLVPAL